MGNSSSHDFSSPLKSQLKLCLKTVTWDFKLLFFEATWRCNCVLRIELVLVLGDTWEMGLRLKFWGAVGALRRTNFKKVPPKTLAKKVLSKNLKNFFQRIERTYVVLSKKLVNIFKNFMEINLKSLALSLLLPEFDFLGNSNKVGRNMLVHGCVD